MNLGDLGVLRGELLLTLDFKKAAAEGKSILNSTLAYRIV